MWPTLTTWMLLMSMWVLNYAACLNFPPKNIKAFRIPPRFIVFVYFALLQSLVQPKAYIVTQGPTEATMPDFWRMAWQEKASCIGTKPCIDNFFLLYKINKRSLLTVSHWPLCSEALEDVLLWIARLVCSDGNSHFWLHPRHVRPVLAGC